MAIKNNNDFNDAMSFLPLIENDAIFRKLIENSYSGIALLDKDFKLIYQSPSAERINGWNVANRLQKTLDDLTHPADSDHVNQLLKEVFGEPMAPKTCCYRSLHTKGHYIWLQCTFTNMLGEPDVKAIVCNFIDVTDQKKLELRQTVMSDALAETLDEKNVILESIGDAFFAVDSSWTITYWNHMASKILMKQGTEMIGHNLWEMFPDAVGSESYKNYQQALSLKKPVHFEDYYQPSEKWYSVSAYPSGNGLSVYFKDVTERLNYINAIEGQNERLKEIAWIQSHVVRAPLARIMGLVTIICDNETIEQDRKEMLSFLSESVNELDEIVKKITDITRIEDFSIKLK